MFPLESTVMPSQPGWSRKLTSSLSAVHKPVDSQGKGIDFHRPQCGRWRRGIDFVGAVVVVGQVQRLTVGTQRDAVRFFDVVRHFDDFTVGVDPINSAMFESALFQSPDNAGR